MQQPKEIMTLLESTQHLKEIPATVMSVLEIDLSSVAHNYNFLQQQLPTAKCSAVVKANAYGLGMKEVAPVLRNEGCEHFFVANIEEGIQLRSVLPEGQICILTGLTHGIEDEVVRNNLTPVLNDLDQLQRWASHAKKIGRKLPAFLHLDTGMWRLGLTPCQVKQLSLNWDMLEGIKLEVIMSHLACSDSPHHDKNLQQLDLFRSWLKILPKVPASMANSHGIFLGNEYQFDLVRPGRSLYGLGARYITNKGIRQAIRMHTRILQVNSIGKGETVGYDAMYCTPADTRLATISVGYADGLSRTLGNHGRVFIAGFEAPMIGRISMDVITIDVGGVPEELVQPGGWAEVIGESISADDVALAAGTTSREIVSKLGTRFHRIYK